MQPIATYTVTPSLPEALRRLPELAYNLRWTWDHETVDLFRRIDRDLWEETNHNPVRMLGVVSQERLDVLACDEGFLANLDRVARSFDEYLASRRQTAWYPQEYGQEERPRIAYFSFEFGLAECIPNYSGGLGVLAGDHLKASSDLCIPLVGIGLLYQKGYFHQYLNIDGWQQELYPENDFYTMPLKLVTDDAGEPVRISITLPGREVYAQIWRIQIGCVDLYLLDTNIPHNPSQEDQDLTDQLYGGDREMRIKQEILLGIGGLRALHALGIEPSVCHMNEGHSAFMALERARILVERYKVSFAEALAVTSASNVFTTHTPVPAGNDYFVPALVEKYFKDYRQSLGLSREEFLALGRIDAENNEEQFCMTILALRASAYANGVSDLHGQVARKMWKDIYPQLPLPEVPIGSISNGVHAFTWVSGDMAGLFDRYLGPRWRDDPTDPEVWQRAHNIPDDELWRTHERRRERLVAVARKRLVAQLERRGAPPTEIDLAHEALDPDALTIGFARRFATYKRATLLLRDPERFINLLDGDRPVQFIFAGKAHPNDNEGKEFIRQIVRFARDLELHNRVVFLEDYDMVVARYLVQGVDVWLNMPRRPQEASGTSGMKAVLNGVINLSVLDGWWAEAYRRDVGWAIGHGEVYEDKEAQDYIESNATYDLLEKDIVPTFYDRGSDGLPRGWLMRMKAGLGRLAPIYNTARMVQEYTRRFYQPALEQARLFGQNDHERGRAFASWLLWLRENWPALQVDSVTSDFKTEVQVGDSLVVTAEVYLGDIPPEDVTVQLYEGVLDTNGNLSDGHTHDMQRVNGSPRGEGWHQYHTEFRSEVTGRYGYTVRVIPHHPDLGSTLRLGLITWA
jgi:starch phosphorylase